jgi:hypothetical protein
MTQGETIDELDIVRLAAQEGADLLENQDDKNQTGA